VGSFEQALKMLRLARCRINGMAGWLRRYPEFVGNFRRFGGDS
jgi:hypothetical protein